MSLIFKFKAIAVPHFKKDATGPAATLDNYIMLNIMNCWQEINAEIETKAAFYLSDQASLK